MKAEAKTGNVAGERQRTPHRCPDCDNWNLVGVEVRRVYDGVLFWVCGYCNLAWSRDWSAHPGRATWAREFVDAHNVTRRLVS